MTPGASPRVSVDGVGAAAVARAARPARAATRTKSRSDL
jgi:hypothetical protein